MDLEVAILSAKNGDSAGLVNAMRRAGKRTWLYLG